jgi:hypothetical protein
MSYAHDARRKRLRREREAKDPFRRENRKLIRKGKLPRAILKYELSSVLKKRKIKMEFDSTIKALVPRVYSRPKRVLKVKGTMGVLCD